MALGELDTLLGKAPRLNDGVDLRQLKLSIEEGYLISQIDGQTPASQLSDVVAVDPMALVSMLRRLESLGIITWTGPLVGPSKSHVAAAHAKTEGVDPAMREVCDLTDDEKQRILNMELDVGRKTHWEVLGLSGNPTAADIKRAYFAASKSYHPDRYFGRNLGSFRDRLEKIFHAIKIAYDLLTNDKERARYQLQHPAPQLAGAPAPQAGQAETAEQRDARLERRRQEILNERRQKRAERFREPPAAAASKDRRADEMYQYGLAQLKAGQVMAAAASFKLAMTYDPRNAQYKAMFEEASQAAHSARAHEVAREAEQHLTAGRVDRAARAFGRAFEMAPQKGDYAVKAADAYLNSGDRESAHKFAQLAVEVSPKWVEAHVVASQVAEARGELRVALEHAKNAERLEGADARVKKAIARLSKAQR